jgi:acetyl-CoA carboxylase carboxyltransferase component
VEADYIENEASPLSAAAGGYIDDVIDPAVTRPALLAALDLLSAKRVHRNPKKHSNIPL